jgi:hypothetical protein
MAKKAKAKSKRPGRVKAARLQYPCRCFKVGDEYEMWLFNPASGTYDGPYPCTREQCRRCNMSTALVT